MGDDDDVPMIGALKAVPVIFFAYRPRVYLISIHGEYDGYPGQCGDLSKTKCKAVGGEAIFNALLDKNL